MARRSKSKKTSRKRPPSGGDQGAGLVALLIIVVVIFWVVRSCSTEDLPRSIEEQIAVMDDAETSLRNLADFVSTQRDQLEGQEIIIERLKKEERELRPALESKQETVRAVLAANDARTRRNWATDMFFSFVTGVASTLAGAWLLGLRRRRTVSEQTETDNA